MWFKAYNLYFLKAGMSLTGMEKLMDGALVIVTLIPGGCFTNLWQALQNNLAKIHNARNHICGENFKLKLCTCAQSMALGTHTKFQLEILIRGTISAIHKFWENILESSRNVSETTPRLQMCKIENVSTYQSLPGENLQQLDEHLSIA